MDQAENSDSDPDTDHTRDLAYHSQGQEPEAPALIFEKTAKGLVLVQEGEDTIYDLDPASQAKGRTKKKPKFNPATIAGLQHRKGSTATINTYAVYQRNWRVC